MLFRNPVKGGKALAGLEEAYLLAGCLHPPGSFSRKLNEALAVLPDPDRAVNNLLRFTEASVSRTSLFNDFVDYPVIREVLLAIFSQSQYLADILVRDPGLFRWLTTTDVLHQPLDAGILRSEVSRIQEMFSRHERRMDGLRRLYRREILRIGAQDILERAPVEALTRQLSDLADVLIQAVLDGVREQLAGKVGETPATPYVVLGLGKLGGRELNYSSDIDLICIYGDEGEIHGPDGKAMSHLEFFHQLTERLVQTLSVATGEGHLYRVDMRLRPEAGAGPLARSLLSTLTYYESRGELWERQMLIKARAVGGDQAFGTTVLARLEPFVYPRTLFQHPSHSVARIKAKIEAAVGDEQNVKLMPGGIRDIEFSVQILQLIHGGKNRAIRSSSTLEALEQLTAAGLISSREADDLTAAYRFFRGVEHRLQMALNTQTHTLPADPEERTVLARKLGFSGIEEFDAEALRHRSNVRTVFDGLVASPGSGVHGEMDPLTLLLNGGGDVGVLEKKLKEHGFRNPRQSLAHLKILSGGSSLGEQQGFEGRTKDALREISIRVFQEISGTPDPDLTLANLSTLASAHRFPHQFFTQLGGEGFRKFILQVCARSPWAAREFSRDPLLLEELSAFAGTPGASGGAGEAPDDPVRYKTRREIRACVRNLLGLSSFDELSREVSEIADTLIAYAFAARGSVEGLAVFGMGKLGSRELNFRGDLDILFVSRGMDPVRADRTATEILRTLTGIPGQGGMYDVDIRLRPEGKNAPPVTDAESLNRYLLKRASLWERQSFTRLRFICGDAGIGREVLQTVADWVYGSPLSAGWIRAVVEMRRRMEPRSQFRNEAPINLKRSSGGMVDVEFISQILQLNAGQAARRLQGSSVAQILAAPEFREVLAATERDVLIVSYLRYREIEKMMRVCLDERSSVIPEGEKLERLARCLDGTAAGEFQHRLGEDLKRIRRMFQAISERLGTAAS